VCLDRHTTGDGIISALQVLRALVENRATLAKATGALALYPQVLVNVALKKQRNPMASPAVRRAVKQAETDLDGSGRVLLRASGTEPVIRVMAEGKNAALVQRWAQRIAAAVRNAA
jgi:phosphoglucosamine mutase